MNWYKTGSFNYSPSLFITITKYFWADDWKERLVWVEHIFPMFTYLCCIAKRLDDAFQDVWIFIGLIEFLYGLEMLVIPDCKKNYIYFNENKLKHFIFYGSILYFLNIIYFIWIYIEQIFRIFWTGNWWKQ